MLESVSADAKYCMGSTPAIDEARIRRVARREVRELAEDNDVDQRRERPGRRIAQAMPRNVCL